MTKFFGFFYHFCLVLKSVYRIWKICTIEFANFPRWLSSIESSKIDLTYTNRVSLPIFWESEVDPIFLEEVHDGLMELIIIVFSDNICEFSSKELFLVLIFDRICFPEHQDEILYILYYRFFDIILCIDIMAHSIEHPKIFDFSDFLSSLHNGI